MEKAKLWGAIALAILLLIVISQNWTTVDTKILFIDLRMPRAVLLFLTAVIGFIAGVLFQRRHTKKA